MCSTCTSSLPWPFLDLPTRRDTQPGALIGRQGITAIPFVYQYRLRYTTPVYCTGALSRLVTQRRPITRAGCASLEDGAKYLVENTVGAEVRARPRLESAIRFQSLIVKRIHSALNLNPNDFGLSLKNHYTTRMCARWASTTSPSQPSPTWWR